MQTIHPANNKLAHHPHPQGQMGGRRKYRKCTCDQDMSNTVIPSSPISTRYREHDDTPMSSESSANSTQFSISTCTSNSYDIDLEEGGHKSSSISMLNSQLMTIHGCHSTAQRATIQPMVHQDSFDTLGTEPNGSTEYSSSNSNLTTGSNTSRGFGRRHHHRFKEKLENIEFVLRRDNNRLRHELSKEATTNHNRVLDAFMEDTDYDADYDDDGIQDELNGIIDYDEMELEERFQELEITQS